MYGGCLLFAMPFAPPFPVRSLRSLSHLSVVFPSSRLPVFPSSLRPFVPPSHFRHSSAQYCCCCLLQGATLFNDHQFVQANNRLFQTSMGKVQIRCKHGTNTAPPRQNQDLNWVRKKRRKTPQTKRTRTRWRTPRTPTKQKSSTLTLILIFQFQ